MTDQEEPKAPLPLAKRGLRLLIGGFAEKAGLWRMRGWTAPADYGRFLARHPRRLGFCLLWTAASGIGQTFFLSLFQPHWIAELGLSTSSMGLLYGAATLLSASLLGRLGAWIDATEIQTVAATTAIGLAAGCALAALSVHWTLLFLAVALLRCFGQGLSSMLGATTAARWFPADQSKAVSVAGLGFPLGEAILPSLVLTVIGLFGWRLTAGACSLAVLILWPISGALADGRAWRSDSASVGQDENADDRHADSVGEPASKSLYRDSRFLLMLATTAPLPFFATGIIFFQSTLGDRLGWSSGAFAVGFFCFAIVRATFSLGVGALADRIGPMRLLGSPLLLFSLGLFLLAVPGAWGVYAFFVCMGLAFGVSGAITTPIWGELFGIERLGAARGASASVTVFATALSPALFGAILQADLPPRALVVCSAIAILSIPWPLSQCLRRRSLRHSAHRCSR